MEYGVTDQGFRRKTYEDIVNDMVIRGKLLFGNDMDLSETSPEGILLRIAAYDIAEEWQVAEKVYNSGYVDTAEGLSLDYTAKNVGIKRKGSESARVSIVFTGVSGTVIPKDFKVETGGEDTKVFLTENEIVLDELGSGSVFAIAEKSGSEYNVLANTIQVITNPIPGINSVTNQEAASGGKDSETDIEFRGRYYQSVEKGGASTGDSIRASLLEVIGVRAALVIINNTMEVDANGHPPKSVSCYVLGGQSEDIGKAILSTIADGIEPFGNQSIVVNDDAGEPHTIKFTYATEKTIYINVSISKNDKYPANGDDLVRSELIKYIGGEDSDGNLYTGLGMGQSVIYNKLIGRVNNIPGIDDFTLEVSSDGLTYTQSNIDVVQAEVAETDYSKVVVTSG